MSYSRNSAGDGNQEISHVVQNLYKWPDPKRSFFLDVIISFLFLLSLVTDKRKGCYFQYVKRICVVFLSKRQMSPDCELSPKVLKGLIKINVVLILEVSCHRVSEKALYYYNSHSILNLTPRQP